MKHNYSFIQICNCFVIAPQFVLAVHCFSLPLYNAHSRPYLPCTVICGTPFSYYSASMESCLCCVYGDKSAFSGDGWFCCGVQWGGQKALGVSLAIGILQTCTHWARDADTSCSTQASAWLHTIRKKTHTDMTAPQQTIPSLSWLSSPQTPVTQLIQMDGKIKLHHFSISCLPILPSSRPYAS